MHDRPTPEGTPEPPAALSRLLEGRGGGPDFAGLERYLAAELDPEGLPRRWAVAQWWSALGLLAAVDGAPALAPRVEGLFRSALRFARAGGAEVFGSPGTPTGRGSLLRRLAARSADPGLVEVVRRWAPSASTRDADPSPPPLPAAASAEVALAALRPDWSARGDVLAIDQRGPGLVELIGGGRHLLGPSWELGPSASTPKPTAWSTGMYADCAEWAFRRGRVGVTRTAVLLRNKGMALIAEQRNGPDATPMAVELAPGVEAATVGDSRLVALGTGRGASAKVAPLGLPAEADRSRVGGLAVEGRSLVLSQPSAAPRSWLPILVTWTGRGPTSWRSLTVAEKSAACPPGVAFAARVSFGKGDGLVVYRSLGTPALRSFLGHQTNARFLVGTFDEDGNVKVLLRLD